VAAEVAALGRPRGAGGYRRLGKNAVHRPFARAWAGIRAGTLARFEQWHKAVFRASCRPSRPLMRDEETCGDNFGSDSVSR
jgi:hypothetical protein